MKVLKVFTLLSAIFLNACLADGTVHADAVDGRVGEEQIGEEIVFPTAWLGPMAVAYRDFRRANPTNWRCFMSSVAVVGDELEVSFENPTDMVVEGDEIRLTGGGGAGCGRAVTYVFNQDGRLLRKYYQR